MRVFFIKNLIFLCHLILQVSQGISIRNPLKIMILKGLKTYFHVTSLVSSSGFKEQGAGFRVQGSGFIIPGSIFRVNYSGRVQNSGFSI